MTDKKYDSGILHDSYHLFHETFVNATTYNITTSRQQNLKLQTDSRNLCHPPCHAQGVGKSSLANTLIGYDNLASLNDKKVRKKLPFKIGHGLRSKTKMTTFSTGRWLGSGPNITVVDTPGFKAELNKIADLWGKGSQ